MTFHQTLPTPFDPFRNSVLPASRCMYELAADLLHYNFALVLTYRGHAGVCVSRSCAHEITRPSGAVRTNIL